MIPLGGLGRVVGDVLGDFNGASVHEVAELVKHLVAGSLAAAVDQTEDSQEHEHERSQRENRVVSECRAEDRALVVAPLARACAQEVPGTFEVQGDQQVFKGRVHTFAAGPNERSRGRDAMTSRGTCPPLLRNVGSRGLKGEHTRGPQGFNCLPKIDWARDLVAETMHTSVPPPPSARRAANVCW